MKVYVIRHGLTELNKQKKVNAEIDEPLALEGVQQAEEATLLLPKTIQYIYSSPMLRAKQTAEIINSKLKIPILPEDALSEIHMGSLAGKSWEEMESGSELKIKHRTVQFDYKTYGGEEVKEVKKRVVELLKKINQRHKDKEVLIVTHGGIIRLLYLLERNQVVDETEKHVSLLTFDLDKILKKV